MSIKEVLRKPFGNRISQNRGEALFITKFTHGVFAITEIATNTLIFLTCHAVIQYLPLQTK